MSNVKVIKVDSFKIGSSKKTKKNVPTNIDYLKNIVRGTKEKVQNKGSINLSDAQMIEGLLSKKLSKKNVEVRKSPQVTKKVPEVTKRFPRLQKRFPRLQKRFPSHQRKHRKLKRKKELNFLKKLAKKQLKKK